MTVEGSVRGEGELQVAGRIRGALTIAGKLVVETGGIVEADVEATDIEVAGLLSGSATAHRSVQVLAGGRMEARVKSPRMLVNDGAVFRGELQAQTSAAVEGMTQPVQPTLPTMALPRSERLPGSVTRERQVPTGTAAATGTMRGRAPLFALPPRATTESSTTAMTAPGTRGPAPKMPALPRGRITIAHRGGDRE